MKKMKGELDSDSESTQLNLALETAHSKLSMEGIANQSLSGIVSEPADIQKANLAISKGHLSLKDVYPFIRKWQDGQKITALDSKPYTVSGDIELMESLLSFSGFSFSQDRNFQMTLEGEVENPFPFSEARSELDIGIFYIDIMTFDFFKFNTLVDMVFFLLCFKFFNHC